MTEQHVPIEDLAAFAAGDLDPAAAVTVEAHVLLCAECRSDVDAVKAATASLGALPPVTMPAPVAEALDEALRRERGPAPATILPMKRRRPSLAGLSAVAAGVALLGALTIPFLSGDDANDLTSAAPESARGTRRLSSGLDYSRDNLAATLDRALAGVTRDTAGGFSAPGVTSGDGAAPAAPSGTAVPNSAPEVVALDTTALRTSVSRLASCITALVGDAPESGRTPLVVDYATFLGRGAVVFVFPSVQSDGQVRSNRVDVYVVGAGCGTEPGGDVLDFQRIVRPPNV